MSGNDDDSYDDLYPDYYDVDETGACIGDCLGSGVVSMNIFGCFAGMAGSMEAYDDLPEIHTMEINPYYAERRSSKQVAKFLGRVKANFKRFHLVFEDVGSADDLEDLDEYFADQVRETIDSWLLAMAGNDNLTIGEFGWVHERHVFSAKAFGQLYQAKLVGQTLFVNASLARSGKLAQYIKLDIGGLKIACPWDRDHAKAFVEEVAKDMSRQSTTFQALEVTARHYNENPQVSYDPILEHLPASVATLKLQCGGMTGLFADRTSNTTLQHLYLQETLLMSAAFSTLCGLVTLDLSECEVLCLDSISHLFYSNMSNLHTLRINQAFDRRHTLDNVMRVLDRAHCLESLTLEDMTITPPFLGKLAHFMASPRSSVAHLKIAFLKKDGWTPSPMPLDNCVAFLRDVTFMRSLVKLELDCTDDPDHDVPRLQALIYALQSNTSLKYVEPFGTTYDESINFRDKYPALFQEIDFLLQLNRCGRGRQPVYPAVPPVVVNY